MFISWNSQKSSDLYLFNNLRRFLKQPGKNLKSGREQIQKIFEVSCRKVYTEMLEDIKTNMQNRWVKTEAKRESAKCQTIASCFFFFHPLFWRNIKESVSSFACPSCFLFKSTYLWNISFVRWERVEIAAKC